MKFWSENETLIEFLSLKNNKLKSVEFILLWFNKALQYIANKQKDYFSLL